MIGSRWIVGMVVAAGWLFAGCGAGLTHESTLTLNNYSDLAVCDVYLSRARDADWGNDWLDEEETILPGQSQAFALTAGRYRIRLDDCEGSAVFGQSNFAVQGASRVDFRAVEVDRRRRWSRRFANSRRHDGAL